MTVADHPLDVVAQKRSSQPGVRAEERRTTVDRVEYSVYPRTSQSQRAAVGFTVDQSKSGLGLRTRAAETVGSTLRVVVRDVSDRSTLDALVRVVWCAEEARGQYRLGLVVVAETSRTMRVVRPADARDEIPRSS